MELVNSTTKTDSISDKMKQLRESIEQNKVDITSLKKYKKTDFRRELVLKYLQDVRKFSRLSRQSLTVKFGVQPKSQRAITVDTTCSRSNCDVVRLALKDLHWREYPTGKPQGSSDLIWNGVSYMENPNLSCGYVNKFPGIGTLLHKVNLFRSLDIMRELYPDEFNFYPMSWYLPYQMSEFVAYHRSIVTGNQKNKRLPAFIAKPDEGCQGDGIYLLHSPEEFRNNNRNYVVQEYLSNPLLLDGFKFDLRIYVVLKSIDPLSIYLYKEGMARFCTVRYQKPTQRNINDTHMHLTNYSLNKKSSNFIHSDEEDSGSKRTLSSCFHSIEKLGYDVAKIWRNIETMVCKTIIGILPELKVYMHSHNPPGKPSFSCFQILGFDILLLDDHQVYLLEVNSNPSMRLDTEIEIAPGIPEYFLSPVDVLIKRPLIKDTLRLMKKDIRMKKKLCRRWEKQASQKSNTNSQSTRNQGRSDCNNNDYNADENQNSDSEDSDASADDSLPANSKELKQCPDGNQQENSTTERSCLSSFVNENGVEPSTSISSVAIDSKSNWMNGNGQLVSKKKSSRLPADGKTFVRENKGEIQVMVSGTSPHIRTQEIQMQEVKRRRERSWLRNDCEVVSNQGDTGGYYHTSSDLTEVTNEDNSSTCANNETEGDEELTEDCPDETKADSELIESAQGDGGDMDVSQMLMPEIPGDELSLTELYPKAYASQLSFMRILENTTEIFLSAIGVKTNLKMGATAFRNFARRCKLGQLGFSSATIDIVFIDLQRRWDYIYPDNGSGLCFQAFLEAFFKVAFSKFNKNGDKLYAVRRMINHCKIHMDLMEGTKIKDEVFLNAEYQEPSSSHRNSIRASTPRCYPNAEANHDARLNDFLRQNRYHHESKIYQKPTDFLNTNGSKSLLPEISNTRNSFLTTSKSGTLDRKSPKFVRKPRKGENALGCIPRLNITLQSPDRNSSSN